MTGIKQLPADINKMSSVRMTCKFENGDGVVNFYSAPLKVCVCVFVCVCVCGAKHSQS